jgi:hypothetical protein
VREFESRRGHYYYYYYYYYATIRTLRPVPRAGGHLPVAGGAFSGQEQLTQTCLTVMTAGLGGSVNEPM